MSDRKEQLGDELLLPVTHSTGSDVLLNGASSTSEPNPILPNPIPNVNQSPNLDHSCIALTILAHDQSQ